MLVSRLPLAGGSLGNFQGSIPSGGYSILGAGADLYEGGVRLEAWRFSVLYLMLRRIGPSMRQSSIYCDALELIVDVLLSLLTAMFGSANFRRDNGLASAGVGANIWLPGDFDWDLVACLRLCIWLDLSSWKKGLGSTYELCTVRDLGAMTVRRV